MTAATATGGVAWRRVAASLTTRGGLGRSMASVGAASALAQLIGLAALPIVSRALGPEAFARFGLFFTLATTLGAAGALGLPEAILAAGTRRDAVALTGATLRAIALMGLVSAAVAFALIEGGAFGLDVLPAWAAAAMAPAVWLMSLMMLLQMMMLRRRRFERLAGAYLAQGVVRAGLQAGLSVAMPALGWLALLLGELGGRGSPVLVMAGPARAELALAARARTSAWLGAARRYWRFPVFRTPSMLANNLASALPLFLIAEMAAPRQVGAFAFMMTIIVGPIGLVQRAVGDVFLGEFAARWRRDRGQARQLLLLTAGALTLMAAAAGAVLVVAGPTLFAWLFGAKWLLAGMMAAAFAPALMANIIVAPLGGALNVTGRPGFKLAVDLVGIAALVAAFLLGRAAGLDVVSQIGAFAAASACAYTVYFGLILRAIAAPGAGPRSEAPGS